MILRPWMFGALCLLLLIYEGVALYQDRGNTISEIIWRLTRYHPLVPFAMGVLMGHFFFQATKCWTRNGGG